MESSLFFYPCPSWPKSVHKKVTLIPKDLTHKPLTTYANHYSKAKTMLTEKRIAANRSNAQKSTGPKTTAGKYYSARNATTHGLLTEAVILPGEDPDRFRGLLRAYLNRFRPATPDEYDLVETMAVNRWRLQRVWSLETAGVIHEQRAQSAATAGQDPSTKYALAHRALSNPPRSLESLSRYEVRCDRQYHRAADRLRRILAERERSEREEEKENMRLRTQQGKQNEQLDLQTGTHRTIGENPSNPDPEPIEPMI